ncbi:MAG: DUF29 domain-containing protein [Geminicoccaceae bacterium]
MAKTLTRPAKPGLYEEDFYVWTQKQAELLRAGRFAELDLPRLIEEVEDLGTSQRSEVVSRSQQILRHFLNLQFSAAVEPRAGWQQTIDDQRDELELVLTPSLRRELEQTLSERYARARRRAAKDLARFGEPTNLPPDCPYAIDEILNPEWLPVNVHGLRD